MTGIRKPCAVRAARAVANAGRSRGSPQYSTVGPRVTLLVYEGNTMPDFVMAQAKAKYPYLVLDALTRTWLYTSFIHNFDIPLRWKYASVTNGSSTHTIVDNQDRTMMVFLLEAIQPDQTLITLRAPSSQSTEQDLRHILGIFHHGLSVFQNMVENEIENLEDMPNPPHLPDLLRAGPVSRGAPTKDYNDWARQQIQAGHDRNSVFLEWLERRGLNSKSPDIRQQYSDAFRKALSRGKK